MQFEKIMQAKYQFQIFLHNFSKKRENQITRDCKNFFIIEKFSLLCFMNDMCFNVLLFYIFSAKINFHGLQKFRQKCIRYF